MNQNNILAKLIETTSVESISLASEMRATPCWMEQLPMISSQYGAVFSNSHYEKLEKVYSIWICTAPPKYMKNSINLYSLSEKKFYGKAFIKKEYYDFDHSSHDLSG